MNVYDADRLRTILISKGFSENAENNADIIIFITCSIRDKAEQKVLSDLGRYNESWEREKKPHIVLLGCMAQRIGADLLKRFPWIRLVAGPRHLGIIPDVLAGLKENSEQSVYLDTDPRYVEELCTPPLKRTNPYKAYITIAHGCDFFCSYCIVPYVRGRFQSRDSVQILNEAKALIQSGVLEITLLGQNVNSYGKDLNSYSFPQLLEEVARIPGLQRLRFTTSHPADFCDHLLPVMKKYTNIAPTMNLPVQSGSDRILKEMNRGYNISQYLNVVKKIRNALPHIALTTDLIVGFPGESEKDFLDSVKLLENIRFDMVHTATYSPREGTVAAKRSDTLSDKKKRERLAIVNHLQASIGNEINQELTGKTVDVLFDSLAPKKQGNLLGRTATDKIVIAPGPLTLLGKIIPVKIINATAWSLEGEIV